MAEVNVYPFLLDRLTDTRNDAGAAARGRGYSPRQLRESLLRDLSNLLNTRAPASFEAAEDFPSIATSVMNYGIPDMTGETASGISLVQLERGLLKAIQTFEPRLEKHSLKVIVKRSEDPTQHNMLTLEIKGNIIHAQMKEPLYVKSELDMQNGQISLGDRGNG